MANSRRQDWAKGPLYNLLSELFPTYRTIFGFFDVLRLAGELGLSHEAVYKWLRKGRLTPNNAGKLLELAQQHNPNLTIRAFDEFVYGSVSS